VTKKPTKTPGWMWILRSSSSMCHWVP